MRRRIRTRTGQQVHTSDEATFRRDPVDQSPYLVGRTDCNRQNHTLLVSYEVPGDASIAGVMVEDYSPVSCSACRRCVQRQINNLENLLEGFSS